MLENFKRIGVTGSKSKHGKNVGPPNGNRRLRRRSELRLMILNQIIGLKLSSCFWVCTEL